MVFPVSISQALTVGHPPGGLLKGCFMRKHIEWILIAISAISLIGILYFEHQRDVSKIQIVYSYDGTEQQ